MADRLWEALGAASGARRDQPGTWREERPTQLAKRLRDDAFAAVETPELVAALDAVFGPGRWDPPRRWGQPLVCFPARRRPWNVPHQAWHLDLPAGDSVDALPGVRVFVFLGRVEPRAGGTVVVTGSHRAIPLTGPGRRGRARRRSAEVRRALVVACPWLRDLLRPGDPDARIAQFMDADTPWKGVQLRVVELTGEPGDVVLMDLRLLHAAAPNCGQHPRLVLGQAVLRRGFFAAAERDVRPGPETGGATA